MPYIKPQTPRLPCSFTQYRAIESLVNSVRFMCVVLVWRDEWCSDGRTSPVSFPACSTFSMKQSVEFEFAVAGESVIS